MRTSSRFPTRALSRRQLLRGLVPGLAAGIAFSLGGRSALAAAGDFFPPGELPGIVDAGTCGVLGDGVSDDAAAINTAIRAAEHGLGRVVILPPGVCKV